MIAILKFNLPDDHDEYSDAINGQKYRALLDGLAQAFRNKAKYSEDKVDWQEARDLFWETVNDHGVNLE